MSDETRAIANVDAERQTIGACLIDNDRIPHVAGILGADDFFRDAHGRIWRSIAKLHEAGRPVDVLGLAEAMGPDYDAVGGDEAFMEISRATPHAENAAHHAQIVKAKSAARQLIHIADEVRQSVLAQDHTAMELVGMAQDRILGLLKGESRANSYSGEAIAQVGFERLQRRMAGGRVGHTTGLRELDALWGVLEPETMIVIGARPSQGKTALLLNLCRHLSINREVPGLFLSLEMAVGKLSDRLLSAVSGVDYRRIQEGTLGTREVEACAMAYDAITASHLHINDTSHATLSQVCALARQHKARHSIEYMMIDYLSLIEEKTTGRENRYEAVKRISNRLKGLAKDLKIPVIVAQQLNRQASGGDRPSMAHLRECGDIEADADIVALLHRPEHYDPTDQPGIAEVITDKSRDGPTGIVRLAWDGAHQRFHNLENEVTF